MNINNKLRVLRNGILYTTYDEALAAITAKKDSLADGEVFVASYGVEGENVKSIFVIKHKGACTLFDNKGIENYIDTAISNLDANESSTDGTNIEVNVKQINGKIHSVSITKDDTINSQDLSGAINALDGTAIAAEAQGNVYTVLTGVEQINGVIKKTETGEVTLAAIAKTGSASDASTQNITGTEYNVAVTGENVPAQILSLATTLKTVQDNAAKYEVQKLKDTEIHDENVREAYKVVSYTGEKTEQTVYTQVGDTIKIYKDSSLVETYIGSGYDTVAETNGQPVITKYIWELKETDPELAEHITQAQYDELDAETQAKYQEIELQYFNLVYQLADGTYSLTHIDISKFLAESEFKDGLKVENGVVKIKIDTQTEGSETYITVSENGLKVSGVNASITGAIENLDATVRGNLNNDETIATGKKVGVKVVETDGKLTNVTVVENDIASATDLTNEITARKAVDGQDGQTYTANSETTYISDATSLNNADVKLDTAIADLADVVEENELVTSAALNDLNTRIIDIESITVIDCGTY